MAVAGRDIPTRDDALRAFDAETRGEAERILTQVLPQLTSFYEGKKVTCNFSRGGSFSQQKVVEYLRGRLAPKGWTVEREGDQRDGDYIKIS